MEFLDIYDENKVKTGRTIARGETLKPGEYTLGVHIWIINSKNQFLIQKRASTVVICPNCWSTTGGAVTAGENSHQALIRESNEEIGVTINSHKSELIYSLMKKNKFCDIWLVREDYDISKVVLQEEEVSDVCYATKDEIIEMIKSNEFIPTPYLHILDDVVHSNLSIKPAEQKDKAAVLNFLTILENNSNKQKSIPISKYKKKLQTALDCRSLNKITYDGELIGVIEIKPKNNPSVYIIDSLYLLSEHSTVTMSTQIIKRLEGIYPQAKKYSIKSPIDNIELSNCLTELNYKSMFTSLGMNYFEKVNR